jgi:SAM-dependent methyltransferase
VSETVAHGHRVACAPRDSCAACDQSGLGLRPALVEIPAVPVHMGSVASAVQDDAFADQRWVTCERCGAVQLAGLAPLDLVYLSQHNGAIGDVWARHHAAFAAFVAERAPRHVVEIGGGTGGLARDYVRRGSATLDCWTVIEPNPGFEPDPPVVVIDEYVEHVAPLVGSADAIVHSHVLEHIYDPRAFLRMIRRHARRDATMLVSVPDLVTLLDQDGSNALNFEHTYFFDLELVTWMLRDGGFTLVDQCRFERHSFFLEARPDVAPGQAGPPPDAGEGAQALVALVDTARADASALAERAVAFDGAVYLFGAHVFSQVLIGGGFPAERVAAVLDNDPAKQGLRLYGTPLPVRAPEVLRNAGRAAVIVRATHYTAEIEDQLRALAPEVELW